MESQKVDQAVQDQQTQINAIKDKMNQIDQLSKQSNYSEPLKQVQEDMLKELYALRENLCANLDEACDKANQGVQSSSGSSSEEVKKLELDNKKLKYRVEHLLTACDELEGNSSTQA